MRGWEGATWGPSRESRRAEMRAYTCCTVSLKGSTVSLRICHSSRRCTHGAHHTRVTTLALGVRLALACPAEQGYFIL